MREQADGSSKWEALERTRPGLQMAHCSIRLMGWDTVNRMARPKTTEPPRTTARDPSLARRRRPSRRCSPDPSRRPAARSSRVSLYLWPGDEQVAPPKKGSEKRHTVGLMLTDAEIAVVDALASSRDMTRAEMLRRMPPARLVVVAPSDVAATILTGTKLEARPTKAVAKTFGRERTDRAARRLPVGYVGPARSESIRRTVGTRRPSAAGAVGATRR